MGVAIAPRSVRPAVGSDAPIVLDCRWLGRGGVGMATELTLRAFAALHAGGEFDRTVVLRGDPALLGPLAWPGTSIEPDVSDPHALLGQRGWTRDQRLEMAFHQVRPLTRRPRIQWLHDLIPIHFARSPLDRALRTAYLRRVVATSNALIVASEHARRCVINELGADPSTVTVITYPVDLSLRAEVLRLRAELPPVRRLLYIGRFARHKNVEGLVRAFALTEFARDGGALHLVGGSADEVALLRGRVDLSSPNIVVEHAVPRSRIIELLATSCGLAQPSFEEGFGLPVWEARTVGLPVIASNCGSLPELITNPANLFDPFDVSAMASAIDRLAAGAVPEPVPNGPTLTELGFAVHHAATSSYDSPCLVTQ
jgi:glycosyltransferase involved in cell wall biosynthesis